MEAPADLMAFARGDAHLLTQAPAREAVLDARRRAVVSRGQDVLVLHEHRAHLPAQARGPLLPPGARSP